MGLVEQGEGLGGGQVVDMIILQQRLQIYVNIKKTNKQCDPESIRAMEISEKKKKKGGTFGNVVDFAGGGVDEKPFGDLLLLVVAEIRFPGIVVGHVRCLLSFPLSPGVSGR